MRSFFLLLPFFALIARAQEPAPATPQGIPPRAAPTEYQAQGKAGAVTIAAEFAGHAIPTADGPLNTDDYVVVEAAFFGEGKLMLSTGDFSLRINGKKAATPEVPYGAVVRSVKDPEWEPEEKVQEKSSKTKFGSGGGGGGGDNTPPAPPKVPIETQRAWAQRVKKVSMPEGDRPLPQGGLLYFPFHGKTKSIQSLELIYSGPAGTATLSLQP